MMAAAEDHGWKRVGGRQPTKEERALWRQIVQDATPLHADSHWFQPETPASSAEAEGASKPADTGKPAKPAPAAAKKPAEKPRAKPLDEGHLVEMDRRLAERFRRGRLPIESRLDLHGMTRAAAHEALDSFVAGCSARELRCVLVITGKGTFSGEGGGVLRREVPRWLNLPGTREKVLAFTSAQRHHGGGGAFYLLLRRRRP